MISEKQDRVTTLYLICILVLMMFTVLTIVVVDHIIKPRAQAVKPCIGNPSNDVHCIAEDHYEIYKIIADKEKSDGLQD